MHSPDALAQNMYGNIYSTATIPVCKGQSDSCSEHTYFIMIMFFIRRSTRIFEIVLLLAISANSCITSDMQTSLNLSVS